MEKDNTLDLYIDMIKNSWTYDRMTNKEKSNIIDIFYSAQTLNTLKYTKNHKWEILQAIYNSYLIGIGYTDYKWRE